MTIEEFCARHPGQTSTPLVASVSSYNAPRTRSLGQIAASVLLWAAEHHPYKILSHRDLARRLLGVTGPSVPRNVVRVVVSAAMRGARRVLYKQGVFVVNVRGVGFRCTVDAADFKQNHVPRLVSEYRSSLENIVSQAEAMVAPDLSDALLAAYERSLRSVKKGLPLFVASGVDVRCEAQRVDAVLERIDLARRQRAAS